MGVDEVTAFRSTEFIFYIPFHRQATTILNIFTEF